MSPGLVLSLVQIKLCLYFKVIFSDLFVDNNEPRKHVAPEETRKHNVNSMCWSVLAARDKILQEREIFKK